MRIGEMRRVYCLPVHVHKSNITMVASYACWSVGPKHLGLQIIDRSLKKQAHKNGNSVLAETEIPFPSQFRRNTPCHICFRFRHQLSVSVSVPPNSVSVSVFPVCFRFSAEKSEIFHAIFIPNEDDDHTSWCLTTCRAWR